MKAVAVYEKYVILIIVMKAVAVCEKTEEGKYDNYDRQLLRALVHIPH